MEFSGSTLFRREKSLGEAAPKMVQSNLFDYAGEDQRDYQSWFIPLQKCADSKAYREYQKGESLGTQLLFVLCEIDE
jgi:hypothetical protein